MNVTFTNPSNPDQSFTLTGYNKDGTQTWVRNDGAVFNNVTEEMFAKYFGKDAAKQYFYDPSKDSTASSSKERTGDPTLALKDPTHYQYDAGMDPRHDQDSTWGDPNKYPYQNTEQERARNALNQREYGYRESDNSYKGKDAPKGADGKTFLERGYYLDEAERSAYLQWMHDNAAGNGPAATANNPYNQQSYEQQQQHQRDYENYYRSGPGSGTGTPPPDGGTKPPPDGGTKPPPDGGTKPPPPPGRKPPPPPGRKPPGGKPPPGIIEDSSVSPGSLKPIQPAQVTNPTSTGPGLIFSARNAGTQPRQTNPDGWTGTQLMPGFKPIVPPTVDPMQIALPPSTIG